MLVVKEYEALLGAYGRAGGNLDALKNREVGNLVIHENKVLSVNEAEGIRVETRETENGVNIYFLVEEGAKIKYPVHLCFGVLPKEGLQEITLRVEAQDNSEVNVIAHCIFPNAVDVIHKKEDDIKIVEKIHLDGKEARGLAKSRLVLTDNARAVVRGETYGNAPFARGHVDCLEIVNGDGVIARAIPVVYVNDKQAKVTHEAAIGSVDKNKCKH
jgi:Fe-S cluster assembly scaffold protein SufB